uniref:Integrase catalytic domain-containing protein n=1 Tax=Pundamilia nyererei TaxID=303518 RepID=A0A3B4GHF4_9CICH
MRLALTVNGQVVQKLKSTFARFGIPDEVLSDNGPQFSSSEFQAFVREMDFAHITSSPHHPQGNGHAERAVQTAKKILRHDDPLIALMCYMSTPCTTTGFSPVELNMGRKIRTTLPTLEKNLQPTWPNKREGMLTKLDQEKAWATPAIVSKESITPRSYLVNRRHLLLEPSPRAMPQPLPPPTVDTEGLPSQCAGVSTPETPPLAPSLAPTLALTHADIPDQVRTRCGRVRKPVKRLDL